jgi:hypothetical protein
MRGRRLIVLFFDLSSMQPEELERAVKAAHDYVEQKLAPADMIAIASFSTSLQVVQDFTADRGLLSQTIDAFGANGAAGLENGGTGDTEDTPDNGNAFTPTTPSSTSSTPIAASTRSRRSPTSCRESIRRNR